MKKTQGFTLIEILVSFAVLVVIVMVSSNLFFVLLRGSTKAKTMQIIKQNGDYSLSVMTRMIRNARSIGTYTSSSLPIINPDGETTTFSCGDVDSDGNNEIASQSGSLIPPPSLISNEVKVVNCNVFTVTEGEPGIRANTVAIDFDLSQASVTDRPEEQALVKFKTTVSLRNY